MSRPPTESSAGSDEPGNRERICQVVSLIPAGHVATYGQVAEMAGLPRRARLVGRVLATLPQGSRLPWFRVINAAGRITFPVGSPSWERQKLRLETDGVTVVGGRVSLATFRWDPGSR